MITVVGDEEDEAFTRWQWVPVAGDARTPSLSEDGTKQGKALYIGVANLQAVGAWVIFCPAAVQLLLRRRGRLLAPPSPAAGSTSTVPKGDAPSASRLSQCMFVFLCLHALPCFFPGVERLVL